MESGGEMSMWQRVPAVARRTLSALPQARLATKAARTLTADKLRILGFHGVDDLPAFERLLRTTTEKYTPVSAEQVVGWLQRGDSLPEHAVWFTFDDGLPSTFDAGGVLEELGISATAFVCPSTVEQPARLWFQTVFAAEQVGIRIPESKEHPSLAALKRLPNHERVAYVTELEQALVSAGHDPGPSLGLDRLRAWRSQGHTIGNHTSSHPCLDTCTETEQRHEIIQAHEQLQEWGFEPKLFAYPNGNHTAFSEQVLAELGYDAAVLFDHRLSSCPVSPYRVSRLRIDSDIDDRRARSILSGSHSSAFHLGVGLASTLKGRRSGHS